MQYKKIKLKEENSSNFLVKNSILNKLLLQRNIKNEKDAERFLNPSMKDLISPYSFVDMEKAVKRIQEAIEKQQKILIWGDFDCDGVTSTTVLYKALKELNANVATFIPDRLKHGHGLNSKILLNYVSKEQVKLIITVDCATSDNSEINLVKAFNVDVIITDHHTTDNELPNAFCIINPQVNKAIKDSVKVEDICSLTYNSGSVIAYKLAMALLENNNNEKLKEELLIIASCGAIADVVPLIGENRAMVTIALDLLNKNKENSQKAIYSLLSKNVQNKPITSYDVAFVLAPRINAVGRLANASLAFEFLNTYDDNKLKVIIEQLDNYNAIRQGKCSEIFDEIQEYLKKNQSETKNPAIILLNPDWHIGIIGIVAAKIVEEYNKPCFLMTVDENNNARCSIRSNELINVYEILKDNENLFLGFGGHKLAGGCSFELNKIKFDEVKQSLLKSIENLKNDEIDNNILYTDIELMPDDVSIEIIDTINNLEPFGQNNEMPIFSMFNVMIEDIKIIGKEKNHLKITVSKDGKTFECVKWFENSILIPSKTSCDIAFYPKLNEFNGNKNVQFEIVEMYSENISAQENILKLYDHRKKTGILEQISDYLGKGNPDICVWAKSINTKEKLSKYENIKNKFASELSKYKSIMLFDYPSNYDELKEILNSIKPEKIHLMNYLIDENIENYIKQINGMLKYCSNKLNGNIDIIRTSQASGVSENFIQLTLEIMENIDSIKIIDVDKIEYIKPFNYIDFKNNSLFEVLYEEFEKNVNFKKTLLNCDIKDFEKLLIDINN